MKYFCSLLFLLSFLFFSCDPDDDIKIDIEFRHFIEGESVVFNDLIYENESDNIYSVQRLMYVISDLTLYCENSEIVQLDDYYFIDLDQPNSLIIEDVILPSSCSSISFRYGLSNENNISNVYINDPNNFHNLMLWPDLIGGGYHYMKLEGQYFNSLAEFGSEYQFYNIHTGSLNGVDYSFNQTIDILESDYSKLYIDMNINNFFNNPLYDFEYFGSAIMQNEEAQQYLLNNLEDVFSISIN